MARGIFSTLRYTERKRWVEQVEMLEPGLSRSEYARAIVTAAGRFDTLILDGSSRLDQLAAMAIARRRRRPRVVITDATWKLGDGVADRLASKVTVNALDGPHVTYGVFSTRETDSFPRAWGVDRDRVAFLPWHHTLSDEELSTPTSDRGGVFSGGDSLRDYAPLVEAARRVDAPFRLATRTLTAEALGVPPNVTVGPTSHEQLTSMTAAASVVVVALQPREDRSSGQGTYLNAMALGKPVVVSDVAGVRDHVIDGETGVVVRAGDARALEAAIRRLLDDPAERRRLGEAARRDVLARFGPDRYVENLLRLARPGGRRFETDEAGALEPSEAARPG
jgi:hypothetical protein